MATDSGQITRPSEHTEGEILEKLKKEFRKSCQWDSVHSLYSNLTKTSVYIFGSTTSLAIRYNHCDIFKWAVDNKCPVSEHTFGLLSIIGNMDFVEHLYENKVLYKSPRPCGPYYIHENYEKFMEIYGDSWKSGRFDVPLPSECPKPAKV